jgi:hypothetical protein
MLYLSRDLANQSKDKHLLRFRIARKGEGEAEDKVQLKRALDSPFLPKKKASKQTMERRRDKQTEVEIHKAQTLSLSLSSHSESEASM